MSLSTRGQKPKTSVPNECYLQWCGVSITTFFKYSIGKGCQVIKCYLRLV